MGSVNKFLCLWEEVFWDDTLQYIGLTTQTRGTFNYFLNMSKFSDVKALMGFSFGEYSIRTETMTDDAVVDAFTSNLKAALGVDIPDPHALLRTRWNTDDCSFGAYSFVPNETRSTLFEVFEQPIDSKVFFAGEHTSRAFRGTVHGAYLSSVRFRPHSFATRNASSARATTASMS